MSRPSRPLPRINPNDLRVGVGAEVVDRGWERLEGARAAARLPGVDAPRARRGGGAVALAGLLVAASLGAFAAGVIVGRRAPGAGVSIAATPSSEREQTDLLAAGEEARTFPLPGGGQLTLSPGATVALQRVGGELTLKLIQGDAKLETAQANAAMLVGDARLNTQAGSTVHVSRRVDNLSVDVKRGTASVDSPSVQQKLASGESVSVPLHRAVAPSTTATPIAVARPRAAQEPLTGPGRPGAEAVASEGPLALGGHVQVAGLDAAATDKEALERVEHAPGGFDAAVRQATSASDLMRLWDLARIAKNRGAASGAMRRLADDFGSEHYGVLAAHSLCQDLGDTPEARKYCERDRQSPLYDPEAEACHRLRAASRSGNKDQALRAAEEYGKTHADGGQCRDEAQRILAGGDEPDPAPSAAPAAPPAQGEPARAPSAGDAKSAPAVPSSPSARPDAKAAPKP